MKVDNIHVFVEIDGKLHQLAMDKADKVGFLSSYSQKNDKLILSSNLSELTVINNSDDTLGIEAIDIDKTKDNEK